MLATDRVVLIDLDNVIGFRPRPRTVRVRVTALLEAIGQHHHAVAGYAADHFEDDETASILALLGVAPLRVPPGPNAGETALLAHARRMQAEGCKRFTVCSGDHAFAALAGDGSSRVNVMIWNGQPVSAKLMGTADHVGRLPRPGAQSAPDEAPISATPSMKDSPARYRHTASSVQPLSTLVRGLLAGIGIAVGNHLAKLMLTGGGQNRR